MPRILLLAGSFGPERVPVRPSGDDARWFEPPHVRDEGAARERIASQVEAGAGIVVAPTWLTHRRALLPVGETRSARVWTAAAVRVAREGVELGLERREVAPAVDAGGAADAADAAADLDPGRRDVGRAVERPEPLVAASLPALDEAPEPETGRLLPREAATARDYRDQAGLVADAGPDLILVEGQASVEEARLALGEAVDTGLPVWAARGATGGGAGDGSDRLERWLEACRTTGCEAVLMPAPVDRAAELGLAVGLRWGGLLGGGIRGGATAWLDAGAQILGLLDGATPAALAGPRDAIDERERAEREANARSEARWRRHLGEAAALAPGGHAVWIGHAPGPLPSGFEWLVVDVGEVGRLPTDHFRLVATGIDAGMEPVRPALLASLLERGGVLATALPAPLRDAVGLRLLSIDESADPPLALLRREEP